jgi:Uma2 family endonuclease
MLVKYLGIREKQWNIEIFVELRIRAREGWFPVPDICVYERPAPDEKVPTRLPLLWIEVTSDDDTMKEMRDKVRDALACGTPWLWVIDPVTLESDLWSASGRVAVIDQTLRLPNSPIAIPLREVVQE